MAKIRLPQATLDREAAYTIRFCASVERWAYGSVFADEETRTFSFAPLRKTEDIHVYHIADVHYRFELAKKTASYFGDALDLLIVNGYPTLYFHSSLWYTGNGFPHTVSRHG